ncbi:Protein LUTEIN DEFICIENT 5, chloroplastic [Glycine soja]|nr:Protein LUTEIN DEFICIENT 5, chloroplastic [Glycine soja]
MASHVALLRAPPPLSISTQRFHAKQISINGLKFTSSSSCFPCSITTQRGSCSSVITCSSSNDRDPNSVDDEDVKQVERILEDKRRAALSAKIASGEFTVRQKSVIPMCLQFRSNSSVGLAKVGVPNEVLEFLSGWVEGGGLQPKIPEAKGSIKAIRSVAFFIPLYELYLTYGGIFRLTFGPKVLNCGRGFIMFLDIEGNSKQMGSMWPQLQSPCGYGDPMNLDVESFLIVSDPSIAKHILRDNSKSYSKGILAEILDFVMGKGLIPADGEIWRVRRRAIVPALHQKYVAAMIGLFGQASDRLCQKLDAAASDGEDVEMESLFSRLTLDIIGKAVFNYDFDSLSNDTGIVEAVYTVLREAEDRSVAPIPVWEIPIWKDISPRLRKVNAALKFINDTLDDLIAICKKMVDEEELQFHEEYMNEKDPSILHFLLASGDDVSSKQLRDDLMTMLIAGHETSAAVLTWTFYLLSKVDSVLGDRYPTIEDMKKLKYTTRVINESLRLYPQPPVLIRRSLEDDVLGEYPIKRGEDIFISVWNLHRSPKLWDDADKFKPERWALDGPSPNETNQNFKYLPFGGGPRKCVGDLFASYETVVALAMLMRRFNFQIAVGAPPVEMTTGATIHTTQGLKMTVTHRIKPPIVPSLQMSTMEVDPSISLSDQDEVSQKGEIYQAQS